MARRKKGEWIISMTATEWRKSSWKMKTQIRIEIISLDRHRWEGSESSFDIHIRGGCIKSNCFFMLLFIHHWLHSSVSMETLRSVWTLKDSKVLFAFKSQHEYSSLKKLYQYTKTWKLHLSITHACHSPGFCCSARLQQSCEKLWFWTHGSNQEFKYFPPGGGRQECRK